MAFFFFGTFLYVALLLLNAIAILSEDRFLAKIGWSNKASPIANSGFGHVPPNPNMYDGGFDGGEGMGVKAKLVNLIGAVRTLMRIPLIIANTVIIVYEIALG